MYYLEIETDQFAGSFEKELCAFIAIKYGDSEVGKEIVDNECTILDDEFIDTIQDSIGVCNDGLGGYTPVFTYGPACTSIRIVIAPSSDAVMEFIAYRIKHFKELIADRIEHTPNGYARSGYRTLAGINILSAKLIHEKIVVTETVESVIL